MMSLQCQHSCVDVYSVRTASELEQLLKKRRRRANKKSTTDAEVSGSLEPGSPRPFTEQEIRRGRAWKILITCWTWLDMVGRGLQSIDHTLQDHTLVAWH